MAVIKLSSDIQCLLSSSVHLFSYKRAIAELVYNALDAQSTSIAIRLHIQQNKIQVVDNGQGIAKENFELLGQKYATSKFGNLTRYKSAPNSYGFRGQSLAGLVEVSKCVKITSRVIGTQETWMKTFYKGKSKEFIQTTTRPSKGTTVEVNGFLYNLNIQNKGINPITEMNEIKTALEQLSLVHNNVSFSLRDDSKNDIIFKAHKNFDIYQTFKSLFDIDKPGVQELIVEKNEYKVVAYVAKNNDHPDSHHWIFLNKKFLRNTKLQTMIHDKLAKTLNPSRRMTKLKKDKNTNKVEDIEVSNNHISFYFIFITCPYYDYDISNTPRQSKLEFKDWSQISNLVEKLVKFYTGELKVKEVKRTENKNTLQDKHFVDDTRQQVSEIIKKILGSNPKKVCVSQIQNGRKGKLIKRKNKKDPKLTLTKVIPPKESKTKMVTKSNDVLFKQVNTEEENTNKMRTLHNTNKRKLKSHEKKSTRLIKNYHKHKPKLSSKVAKNLKIKKKYKKDSLLEIFKKQPDVVVERCNLLAQEVDHLIPHNNNRKQTVFINETVNYSNKVTQNKNISTRQRVGQIIIYDYVPLKPQEKPHGTNYNNLCKTKKDCFKTSYDLLRTKIGSEIINTENVTPFNQFQIIEKGNPDRHETKLPQLTYQSHHYISNETMSHHCGKNENIKEYNKHNKERHFVFTQPSNACDNDTATMIKVNQYKYNTDINAKHGHSIKEIKQTHEKSKFCLKQFDIHSFSDKFTSHTIEFSNSKYDERQSFENNYSARDSIRSYEIPITTELQEPTRSVVTPTIGFTYTVTTSNVASNFTSNLHAHNEQCDNCWSSKLTYSRTKEVFDTQINDPQNDKLNVIFISNSYDANSDTYMNDIQPINVCETILNDSNELEPTNQINDSRFNLTLKELSSDVRNVDVMGDTQQLLQSNQSMDLVSTIAESRNTKNKKNVEFTKEQILVNANDGTNNLEDAGICSTEDAEKEASEAVIANDFEIRNRPRFLPKGMSPIFENRCIKTKTDANNVESGYFADDLYHKFRDEVQTNTEVFEAHVQNPKDFVSSNIAKVNNRLEKDNSSLTFNAESLSKAKVLRQIDNKFIATLIKSKSEQTEFLVLFDQHAVHERICLEDNLLDYFKDNEWRMVKLDDDVTLKLSKEEIIYLHNYKDKFTQFGLDWTILNNYNIKLHGIPAAILGKNSRQAEKVISAVKNFISEEINMMRSQKGCVSLYPKSIMDLVFSEACRYAIKFGDKLPDIECVELIKSLSTCKTPFQCAHGRPVMAVIMDIKPERRNFQINMVKLKQLATNKPKIYK